jgi:hypothetical protein
MDSISLDGRHAERPANLLGMPLSRFSGLAMGEASSFSHYSTFFRWVGRTSVTTGVAHYIRTRGNGQGGPDLTFLLSVGKILAYVVITWPDLGMLD